MKICLGITRLKSDLTEAISKNFYNLSEELINQGQEVTTLSPVEIKAHINSNLIIYSKNHPYESKTEVLNNIKKLSKYINKNYQNFDAIHLHVGFLFEAFLLKKLIKNLQKPIFITIWQPYMGRKEFFSSFKFFFLKPANYMYHFLLNSFIIAPYFSKKIKNTYNKIIFSNEYQKNQVSKYIPENKIKIIPNGLTKSKIKKKIENNKEPKILYIGHFTPFKGTDALLESIRYLKTVFPNTKLTLAWSGYGSRKKVIKMIKKLKIKENIILKNKIDVYEELSKNDFLVVPYRSTIGTSHYHNVLIEALSSGTPIFASKIGSIPELISENQTGIFINPDKPKEIAKKILNIFKNNELKENISKNSEKLFKQKFLLKDITKKHIEAYNESK
jgi:glycosyltransferase involved in cell wall biosynthesis